MERFYFYREPDRYEGLIGEFIEAQTLTLLEADVHCRTLEAEEGLPVFLLARESLPGRFVDTTFFEPIDSTMTLPGKLNEARSRSWEEMERECQMYPHI